MCVSPVALTREIAGKKYTQFVPCGKCEECIKDKQNEYVIRTVEEAHKMGNPWFITLTYSEDTVPFLYDEDESGLYIDKESGECFDGYDTDTGEEYYENYRILRSKDVQDWKKRVKRSIEYHTKKKLEFSYLICGEYGPRTHRPHYHGLLLGLTDEQVMKFKKDWEDNFGYACFEKVPMTEVDRVGAYVAKYICKQTELEDPLVTEEVVPKPRKITSRGYGMPTKKRFDMMRRDVLGEMIANIPNPDDLNGVNAKKLGREIKRIADNHKKKYKLNGREYKLPSYYWKKFTYVKDALTGKDRASQISKMVSKALQDRVQTDFAGKLIQMAYGNNLAENYEECRKAAKIVCANEKMERQERARTIIETNITAFRKSKF